MGYSVHISKAETLEKKLNIWSNPQFMQAVGDLHKLEAMHLKVFKGEQPVALLPVYEQNVLGYRVLKSPAASYYQGLNLWLEDNSPPARKLLDTLQIIQSLASFLVDRYRRIKLNLSPETFDIRGFSWKGLKAIPLYTFCAASQTAIKPLPDERKKINLALQQDYRFDSGFELSSFCSLFQAMNEKKHREPGFTLAGFSKFLSTIHALGIMQQYNLILNGKIVSSNILLRDGNKAYTVFRATDPEALKNGASGLHSLKLLEALQHEGISELDFCGANVPEIARFKAALGLDLRIFFRIIS